MKQIFSIFVLALLAVSALAHAGHDHSHDHDHDHEDHESAVLTLGVDTFDEAVKEGNVMVKFYAPWCGHCKALAPTWEKAAKELVGKAKFAKVNCDEEKSVCDRFGVQGFPTLKLFREGSPSEYNGGRTLQDFQVFLERMNRPPVSDIATSDDLKSFVQTHPVAFVLFGKSEEARAALNAAAAKHQAKMDFAAIEDAELASTYAANTLPATYEVALVAVREEKPSAFTGPWTAEALAPWIAYHQFEFVPELGPHNFNDIRQLNLPLVIVGTKQDTKTDVVSWTKQAAEKFGSHFFYTYIDAQRWDKYLEQSYEVSRDDTPVAIVVDLATSKYYTEKNLKSAEQLAFFLEKAKSGALKPASLKNAGPGGILGKIADLVTPIEDWAAENIWTFGAACFMLGIVISFLLFRGEKKVVAGEAVKNEKTD